MMAPPPTPNSPARRPVTAPPTTMAAASQASSPAGMPSIIRPLLEDVRSGAKPVPTFADRTPGKTGPNRPASRRCGLRHWRWRVHHKVQRLAQDTYAGAGFDGVNGDMPAERTGPRYGAEQSEQVAG